MPLKDQLTPCTGAATVLSVLLLACAAAAQANGVDGPSWRYRIDSLAAPIEGGLPFLYGLNNRGDAVLNVVTSTGPYLSTTPFLYSQGSFHNLGSVFRRVAGIGDRGELVGYPQDYANFGPSGLYYDQRMTRLPSQMNPVDSISSSGQWFAGNVSGQAGISNGQQVWSADVPGAVTSAVSGINNQGVAIGTYIDRRTNAEYGFLFDRERVTLLAGASEPGNTSRPTAINNTGAVVGIRPSEGFLYRDGVETSLGAFRPSDINDEGWMVSYDGGLLRDGVVQDLHKLIPAVEQLHWDMRYFLFINNAGQIAGEGLLNGKSTIFLLTPVPVPEPASVVLMLCGLGVLGGAVRCLRHSGPPTVRQYKQGAGGSCKGSRRGQAAMERLKITAGADLLAGYPQSAKFRCRYNLMSG